RRGTGGGEPRSWLLPSPVVRRPSPQGFTSFFTYRSNQARSLSILCTLYHEPAMPCGWPAYWIIFAGTPCFLIATYNCWFSEYGTRLSISPLMNSVGVLIRFAYVIGDCLIIVSRAFVSHGAPQNSVSFVRGMSELA